MSRPAAVLGWDIGGVNTKAVRVDSTSLPPVLRSVSRPYEVQYAPGMLGQTLVEMAAELGAGPEEPHAVTMTAELSQLFRTKREGVVAVLKGLEAAFPRAGVHVYAVDGRFLGVDEAGSQPLAVAAANWAATARLVARAVPSCILIDIGSTSTDLIPIVSGKLVALGTTDPERLLSGELLYTGALRTPVEAVTGKVPLWGGHAAISAEAFAITGDVHLWLGQLRPEDYTCRTPDSRPATREFAGERLARVVCADREMLDEADIDSLATAIALAQRATIIEGIERIRQRWRDITSAVVTGLGDFIATQAAGAAGLAVIPLAERLGAAARTAPAAAVALLLGEALESER